VDHRDTFVDDCYAIGVRPVIIDMGHGVPTHSMTTSTLKDSNDTMAFVTAHSIAKALEDIGYDVERIKIETVPWHPKASCPESEQYFETHFAIDNPSTMDNVLILGLASFLHRSRNVLKKNDKNVQMYTYRSRDKAEHFRTVTEVTDTLKWSEVPLNKVITEFALYDTNERMDDPWLKSLLR
jgi:hypothetical protein